MSSYPVRCVEGLRVARAIGLVPAWCLMLGLASQVSAENWPQWRGPDHNGVSRETNLPVRWSETAGVAWRCSLPAWGTSTPVVWGDAVFVTAQSDEGALLLLRIEKSTGRIVWRREVGSGTAERTPVISKKTADRGRQFFHPLHNMATPSPAVDADVVIAHFGTGDLAAYDHDGRKLWRRDLQKDHGRYTIWWGHSNSPILYEDTVISVCIQDSCRDLPMERSESYVAAHDKQTGELRWKVTRDTGTSGEPGDAYTTPLLWKNGEKAEVLIAGGLVVDGYDPASGKRLWHLDGLKGNRMVGGPVVADGVVYLTQGMRNPLIAVRLGGRDRLPASDILWTFDRGTPDSPTPVVDRGMVFFVNDAGIARCLDARTGKVHWEQRFKGDYRASPLAADGRIYFVNTKGLTTVVAASKTFERLAENKLDDEVTASPIVSDGRILLRCRKALYCLDGAPGTDKPDAKPAADKAADAKP